jgi:hypothetical protein
LQAFSFPRSMDAPSKPGPYDGLARDAGYRKLTLWTNSVLDSARRIYERKGFRLTKEERHHSFGKDLVGQNWNLDLRIR